MDVWSTGFSVIGDKESLEEVLFGPRALILEGASLRSFIMSAVRMLKKPCAIKLEIVMICSRLYLIEYVL